MRPERWVMAAISSGIQETVLSQTDLVIYLDYPPALTLSRLLKRTAHRLVYREKCCNGNTESLPNLLGPNAIIRWWFKTYQKHQRTAQRFLADSTLPKTLRLTHPAQLDLLLS